MVVAILAAEGSEMGSTGRIKVAMEAVFGMGSSDGTGPEPTARLQFCKTSVEEEEEDEEVFLLTSSLVLGMQQGVAFS